MKNLIYTITVLAATAVLFSSCSYSSFTPIAVTDNQSLKTGETSVKLKMFGNKDMDLSIATAAKNGGITKIATVDYKVESGFLKPTVYTVVVTGE